MATFVYASSQGQRTHSAWNKIADISDIGLVGKSTEEVLNKFEELNKMRSENPKFRKLIIASMDIEKWYPNVLSKPSAKIVRKIWVESGLTIEGVDMEQLALYLGKYLSMAEVVEEAFEEIIYTKEVKAKKMKVTKKVSKRHVKNRTRNQKRNKKEFIDKPVNSSVGADTHNTTVDEENSNENMDKEPIDKKKTKKTTTIWKKPMRKPTDKEQTKIFGKLYN